GGQDLTFSAPKSVSVLAFCSEDPAVRRDMLQAHREAQRETIQWLEKECAAVNIYKDRKISGTEKTGNLIVSSFTHDSSRPVRLPDGSHQIDPQLHTHAIVHNMTKDRTGKWRAIAFRDFYTSKMLAGAIYHNALEKGLRDRGYETLRNNDTTFEVKGVPAALLERHSQRRTAIEAYAKKNGIDLSDPKQMAKVTKNTRVSKKEVDSDRLHASWRESGRAYRLTREALASDRPPGPAVSSQAILRQATDHVSERKAVLTDRDILLESLRQNGGRHATTDLEAGIRKMKERGELIHTSDGRLATKDQLEAEHHLLTAVRAGKGAGTPLMKPEQVDFSEYQRERGFELSAGQKSASEELLTTADRYIAIQGYAGAGKTTFLQHSAEQLEKRGACTVRGFAPSAAAAAVLQKETGIKSQTLDSFLQEAKKPMPGSPGVAMRSREPGHREVWIIDESSMLSSRKAAELVTAADRMNAQVVFLGDTKQLSAIEAGNPFEQMQKHGIRTVEVTEINRQQLSVRDAAKMEKAGYSPEEIAERRAKAGKYQEAVYDVYRGAMRTALEKVDVVELRDARERGETLVKDYFKYRDADKHDPSKAKDTLIGTSRNDRIAELNGHIRDEMKNRGELQGDERRYTTLKSKGLTDAEARQPKNYRNGDIVQFRAADKDNGIEAGAYGTVTGRDERTGTITVRLKTGRDLAVPLTVKEVHTRTMTPESKRDAAAYREGETVTFNRNYPSIGIKRGDSFTIQTVQGDTVHLADKEGRLKEWTPARGPFGGYDLTVGQEKIRGPALSLYYKEAISLQEGDRIRFTENIGHTEKTRTGQVKTREFVNGISAKVLEVGEGTVRIEYEGHTRTIDLSNEKYQHLKYGYAATFHDLQGQTGNRILMEADTQKDKALLGEKTGLVGLTRGQHEAIVYTDDRENLPGALGKKQGQEYAVKSEPERTPVTTALRHTVPPPDFKNMTADMRELATRKNGASLHTADMRSLERPEYRLSVKDNARELEKGETPEKAKVPEQQKTPVKQREREISHDR
ncbi:MAG TPA: MobF family relaxase, partial [bacterium]|nr:MobF family relaxase [bacterium]